jgi:hypothetical protein
MIKEASPMMKVYLVAEPSQERHVKWLETLLVEQKGIECEVRTLPAGDSGADGFGADDSVIFVGDHPFSDEWFAGATNRLSDAFGLFFAVKGKRAKLAVKKQTMTRMERKRFAKYYNELVKGLLPAISPDDLIRVDMVTRPMGPMPSEIWMMRVLLWFGSLPANEEILYRAVAIEFLRREADGFLGYTV